MLSGYALSATLERVRVPHEVIGFTTGHYGWGNSGLPQALLDALEVLEATGRSLADWHRDGMPAMLDPGEALMSFLDVDRDELRRRIDARFDAMLAQGALDEVRRLAARNLDPMLPAMKAHGVPWLRRYLTGEITLAEAAEGGKADTRRYTKRQATWFRHQMPGWQWAAPEAVAEIAARELA